MAKELTKEEEEQQRKKTLITNVVSNYKQVEQSIVNQLYMKHDLHGTTIGSERELIWSQLFEMIGPKKFVIEQSVFIIDSDGRVSKEVDFAIMDETYTPYIFRYGRIKFVPIEAVSAVIECKSQKPEPAALEEWANSIKRLRTSGVSIARMANMIATNTVCTQKSTRPIRILCALQDHCSDSVKDHFDFTLLASKDKKGERIVIQYKLDQQEDNLYNWFLSLNFHLEEMPEKLNNADCLKDISLSKYEVKDSQGETISLLTFNFQFNQLLMLINNPLLFPHRAYVDLFNRKGKEEA